jgi:hypothetical protein
MEDLDKQRLLLIALELDIPSVLNFCSSNKRINALICKNSDFWKAKLIKDFAFTFYGISDEKRNLKQYYFILYNNTLNSKRLCQAVKFGYIDLVKFISESISDLTIWNIGMKCAVESDSIELLDYFISKGANDWTLGLRTAAKSGNIKLINYFIKKLGNNISNDDWNDAVIEAGKSQKSDAPTIIKYLQGKMSYAAQNYINWREVVRESIRGKGKNTLEIIKYIPDKWKKEAWNQELEMASEQGDIDVVKYLIGLSKTRHISDAIDRAINGNHFEIIKFLVDSGVIFNVNYSMIKAASQNNMTLVQYFVEKGAFKYDEAIKQTTSEAIKDYLKQKRKEGKIKIKEMEEDFLG